MRMTTEQKREIVEGRSKSTHSGLKQRLSITSMIAVRKIVLSVIRAASVHSGQSTRGDELIMEINLAASEIAALEGALALGV